MFKNAAVLAGPKGPGHFGSEQAETRTLVFMSNPHLASEMLKINPHLHLISLCHWGHCLLEQRGSKGSLSGSQSSSQSPIRRDADVNEQEDQQELLLGIKNVSGVFLGRVPSLSACSPAWL